MVFLGVVLFVALYSVHLNILEGLFLFLFSGYIGSVAFDIHVSMFLCLYFWRQQERVWRWESVFISVFLA